MATSPLKREATEAVSLIWHGLCQIRGMATTNRLKTRQPSKNKSQDSLVDGVRHFLHLDGSNKITTLQQLFVEQLKDLHSAETQLIDALPKMAAAAHAPALK